jgi:hypothetical protein
MSERMVAVRGDGGPVEFAIDSSPAEARLRSARIARTAGKLLLECGSGLLNPIYSVEVLQSLPEARVTALVKSLDEAIVFLTRLDGPLSSRISANIRLYLPVKSPSARVHVSFTVNLNPIRAVM